MVVHKWFTEDQCDALKGLAKVCREDGLEDEDLSQWTKKVTGNIIWKQVLEDVEVRNVFTQNIMWKSLDFFVHVVGETERRGAMALQVVLC